MEFDEDSESLAMELGTDSPDLIGSKPLVSLVKHNLAQWKVLIFTAPRFEYGYWSHPFSCLLPILRLIVYFSLKYYYHDLAISFVNFKFLIRLLTRRAWRQLYPSYRLT